MSGKNKSDVNSGKSSRKSINEQRGIGSNPSPKSVSPGPPGSSKPGTKKEE